MSNISHSRLLIRRIPSILLIIVRIVLYFRVFFGDDPKVRCEMEVERTHDGICKLKEALDALDELKERLGDAFPDKKYEQQKKRLVLASLKDDMRAAKVGGVKAEVAQVHTKLSWTLVNSAVGTGHHWESAYACLDEKIIPGDWISDRMCPTSQVGGCETRRRCCDVDGERYYARLVKHPAGKFGLYQGTVKIASEVEAPSVAKEEAKEEANETKEVRPPAHHCHSLLTAAHCSLPTDACSACSLLTVHAVLPASHVWPSFSHCYLPLPSGEEEDKQGRRETKGRRQRGWQHH